MEKQLSHTDETGKASMVDVGQKPEVIREATAKGRIVLSAETMRLIRENLIKKGDVLTIAEIAGIQAAKRTPELIPLCHPLLINAIDVRATLLADGAEVVATARCTGRTGVEMEALTAVSVGLLTIYDMCKAVDNTMVISEIQLIEKKKGEACA
jgi:cyclic pyranopterin monophosphate synthase